ncbi:MAG: zinc-dependent alcohol dehydrogenase family protein [Oryzomonas sp.]|uniref:zinc-dependent alcohol dehydrogenase family protein n=1 Tax=Oryzomonas sp. TaxID=2855186 RepID=UPI00283F6693|nr:zinc-dependent alcohol dehydrogenase family protein [Oryzomonas sp.]MDR3581514.1 zinc-dependent alcohol dehydrogenase family protein [Oryzomonas sp.]
MRAMVLERPGTALELREMPIPRPSAGELLLNVKACGICRTDLHVMDGELTEPKLPLVPGHQIVGVVEELGLGVAGFQPGDRVGVPWLGGTCGECDYCLAGRENLCDQALFTGYQTNGGFADYCTADSRFCFPLPEGYPDTQAAPLLCAGLIGFRSLRMAGDGKRIGIYGFGAAAHIVTQVATWQGREVYAFTRPGDAAGQNFAREMGACWAGGSFEPPPQQLAGAIIFAPAGELVPAALKAVAKGGIVVCGGIHMSDIPAFPYDILWGERSIVSVANLTRRDGVEFLKLAPQVPVRTEVELFPLERANEALAALREGRIRGAAVLVP